MWKKNTHFQQNKLYNLRRQLIDDSSVPILHPVPIVRGALTGFSESQIGYVLSLPLLTPHSNMGKQENHGSNETEPGCFGLKGDYTIPLCGDYSKPLHIRIPIKQPVWWKVRGFFSRLTCIATMPKHFHELRYIPKMMPFRRSSRYIFR